MKPNLHMGHVLAGLFLLAALLASGRPPEHAPALRAVVSEPLPPAPGSLAAYLAANPTCREISDGCQVCVRAASDSAQCSTPGIACGMFGRSLTTGRERAELGLGFP